MHRDLVAQIDLQAIRHNLARLRQSCGPQVRVCPALKANAYGHGIAVVAPALEQAGVEMAGVATLGEAVELRDLGWKRPVLLFGPLFAAPSAAERAERIDAAVAYDLTCTLVDGHGARDLALAARRQGKRARVHLKVDSGMGRMGISPATAIDLAGRLAEFPEIGLEGIYSHLATAEWEDETFASEQMAVFAEVVASLRRRGLNLPIIHLANSAAALHLPASRWNMIRPGLALYGYRPRERGSAEAELRPSLRLVSHLVLVKQVPPGHAVGYERTFTTTRPSTLGIVPIGYNDGYLRALSNRAMMSLPAGDTPVVGNISMDQTILDLTDLMLRDPAPKVGDEVVIIDNRRERPNSVESLAKLLGTVPYEITCLLGNRVARVGIEQPAG